MSKLHRIVAFFLCLVFCLPRFAFALRVRGADSPNIQAEIEAGLEEFVQSMSEIAEGRAPTQDEIQELVRMLLSDPVQGIFFGVPSRKTVEAVVSERIRVMQKSWPVFSAWWREYLKTDQIPMDTLWRVYLPFSQWIVEQKRRVQPHGVYVVGIYGSQGRGKTVTSRALVPILNVLLAAEEGQAVARAIDDYYLSKKEREDLRSLGYDAGLGVSNRGPAGTHDTSWILRNTEEFDQSTAESRIEVGNFDKKIDDQPKEPLVMNGKVGVFLFDGWFNGANTHFDLGKVPAGFKRIVAEKLQVDYKKIFDRFDVLWVFDTPPIEEIEANRQQQEDLLEQREGQRGMTREAIHRFVSYFYQDSWDWENTSPIPRMEDTTFLATIGADRHFVKIERGGRPDDKTKLSDVGFLTSLLEKELETKPWDAEISTNATRSDYIWRVNRYFVGRIDRRGEGTEYVTTETLGKDVYEQETGTYMGTLRRLFPDLAIEQRAYSFPENDAWLEHGIRRTGTQHHSWVSVDRRVAVLLAERWAQSWLQIDVNKILKVKEGGIVGANVERLIEALAQIFPSRVPYSPAGLEEEKEIRDVEVGERLERTAIQDQFQTALRDITQLGFTYQIVDQSLVEDYPGLAVLSELHPGVWIDRSQNQEETNRLVADLVSRGVRWVDHYGESERGFRFRTVAQHALIDVRVPKVAELELLKQLLANLAGLNDSNLLDARLERMGLTLQQIASWLDQLA